ncbi:MAG: PxKF domain-containing protein, partial [Chloroflexota bacterium]
VANTKVYGAADPSFTWTFSGFAFSDDASNSSITGLAACSRTAGETVAGNPYTITCASGTLLAPNYSFVTGTTAHLTITKKDVTGAFTAANKVWDNNTTATVVTTTVAGALVGDDVQLTGGTATFATSTVGTWTVTLTGAGLTGSAAGNYNLTSVGTTTATITTAFRIIGFDSPVDMTVAGDPRTYNSVKNGQTVPLKFRVFNLNGTEVTSTAGLNAWARNVACASGVVEPDLIPITSTADTGLRRTGDRFHFNWAVPKGALKCYQVLIQTVDGSTTMVGSLSGTPVQEAWFKSK